ncbi:MAG: HAD-IIIA family hydrolase [candidate division Zixibacteria bacterium]|nr:HAD-IIIA family hydrolase [candidate division Zixibacteria bacterium]
MVCVALIDRDGVLNRDRPDYIKNEDELEVFSFARAALETFKDAGWLVYVVSNQSVVGRGLASVAAVEATTAKLVRAVGPVDGVFYCYHRPEDECGCRKPEPGLLLQGLAAAAAAGALEERWMVGDSARDVEAGRRAGCRTAVVLTGHLTAEEARRLEPPPDVVADDVLEAAKLITAPRGASY